MSIVIVKHIVPYDPKTDPDNGQLPACKTLQDGYAWEQMGGGNDCWALSHANLRRALNAKHAVWFRPCDACLAAIKKEK